ncbi:MAG: sensor histidine kinase [Gemmatimonadetes bacterium]|nr:sensor histidine kinase [Gemmatimonadota bacterium]
MSERASRVFKKKVFEVYQNAVVHSESELGVFVCGQFFPQQHRLDFTITDVGIGIREAVRRYFDNPHIDSLPALKWALEPYHTTKSGPHPGGLGLEFLQKFARLNKGKIQIASRFGFYELNCDKETFEGMAADLPGTAVTIGINTADEGVYVLKSEIDTDDVS